MSTGETTPQAHHLVGSPSATVLVFGSNVQGVHGSGSALGALRRWGAVQGQGEGLAGLSYALPTKLAPSEAMGLQEIGASVERFLTFANEHPNLHFEVSRVACGRGGYSDEEIAPMFTQVFSTTSESIHKSIQETMHPEAGAVQGQVSEREESIHQAGATRPVKAAGQSNVTLPAGWQRLLGEQAAAVDTPYEPSPFYAGIGSRETPQSVLHYMERLAAKLAQRGLILRTGGAPGADSAFERGARAGGGQVDLWLPWAGFEQRRSGLLPTMWHARWASTLHPAWDNLGRGPRHMHARNVGQVLGYGGRKCDRPVGFVVAWTPDGCESYETRTKDTGGTATAIVLAEWQGIPVFNLQRADARDRLNEFILSTYVRG